MRSARSSKINQKTYFNTYSRHNAISTLRFSDSGKFLNGTAPPPGNSGKLDTEASSAATFRCRMLTQFAIELSRRNGIAAQFFKPFEILVVLSSVAYVLFPSSLSRSFYAHRSLFEIPRSSTDGVLSTIRLSINNNYGRPIFFFFFIARRCRKN